MNVIVTAEAADKTNIILLGSDQLATYEDFDDNGVRGSAFGDLGGFHHTVELCTLNAEDPVAEEGDCASFAFVKAYTVDGQVWKNGVEVDDDDGFDLHLFEDDDPVAVPGIAVSMDPVAGRNLAGESDSHTTTFDDDDTDVDDTVKASTSV